MSATERSGRAALRLRWSWGLAGLGLAVALAARLWPVDRAPDAVAPALTPVADTPVPASGPSADAVERLAQHNVFDPSRRPPAERELLAVADTFPEPMAVGDGDSVAASPEAGFSAEPVPALHGVVDGPSGRRALLRLDAASPRAALFGVGDGTAGWRVVQIGPESVTLDGPAGRQVVSLPSRPRTP